MLRNYGSAKKYENEIMGTNSRSDDLQAALLQVGLDHFDDGCKRRAQIAERYLNEIHHSSVTLPQVADGATHVWHIFALRSQKRDTLQQWLSDNEIGTAIHYPIPPALQKCYMHLGYHRGDQLIAERYAEEELSLPIYNGMPDEHISAVIDAINRFEG